MDLSLVRIKHVLSLLPKYRRPTIHVAGTNGKGSVTAILSSIFTASHISVGRFNSPHLLHVWDSISINGRPISPEAYHAVRSEVESLNASEKIGLTNFELMTATATQIFERAGVEIAIFEVGLGGRLDATNALPDEVILASAITNVDLDHQKFLGNTPGAIAHEKAGIARKGKPLILGEQKYSEVEYAVENFAGSIGAKLTRAIPVEYRPKDNSSRITDTVYDAPTTAYTAPALESGTSFHTQHVRTYFSTWETSFNLELPLQGAHQLQNLGTAMTVLGIVMKDAANSDTPLQAVFDRISPTTIYSGVLDTRWPGRLDRVVVGDPSGEGASLTVLVDGAHNPSSAQALNAYLISMSLRSSSASSSSIELRTSLDNDEDAGQIRGFLHRHNPFKSSSPTPHRPPRTFILSLSHSPPKSPYDTLAALLQKGDNVAFVPFSPVEDMPWVKYVDLDEMERIGRRIVFEEKEGHGHAKGKGKSPESSKSSTPATPTPTSSTPGTPNTAHTPTPQSHPGEVIVFSHPPFVSDADRDELTPLRQALEWANTRVKPGEEVVLAGSLYLVADLYRLLQDQWGEGGMGEAQRGLDEAR
ncbi:hypothetical protein M422DRAFT_179387 [Sphaerobolus stellatus SS14]|uniref:Dihydrofolate synthase n=1 Tax=Sphaerobolus stellatus (strain SS14) TaxID=990650 RepID=A0A0C9VGE2_SPHS4|nr:hypothetical protein M422DRAFT_179387 [Sphaerobolus stellatus SS14]